MLFCVIKIVLVNFKEVLMSVPGGRFCPHRDGELKDCCFIFGVSDTYHFVFIQTMIEAHVDVKTTDGYLLRLFCVGFTKRRNNQIRKTSYAQHQQVRQIRKKMMEIMTREVQTNDLKEVVNKL